MTRRHLAIALLAGSALGGCEAQGPLASGPQAVAHRVLYSGAMCGTDRASLQPMIDVAALQAAAGQTQLRSTPVPLPPVDFSREAVFRLALGELPTAGGGLNLGAVHREPATLSLVIEARRVLPDPGRMQAMVITRPCVLFSVPRAEYARARAVEPDGTVWLETALPR